MIKIRNGISELEETWHDFIFMWKNTIFINNLFFENGLGTRLRRKHTLIWRQDLSCGALCWTDMAQ